jgi:hypothetical protein
MTEPPPLEKSIWTDADFDIMGWHDASVWAFAVEGISRGRLLLDIDYLIEWVRPVDVAGAFNFWICPSTLVFHETADLTMDMDLAGGTDEPSIDSVSRSEGDPGDRRVWTIGGHEFTWTVTARGFTQYLRTRPVLSQAQSLTADERGGISFEERGFLQ